MTTEYRRNFFFNVWEGVAFGAGMVFLSPAAVVPLYLSQQGASESTIGLVVAIFFLFLAATQFAGALYFDGVKNFFEQSRIHFIIPRLMLFVLAVIPWLHTSWALPAFLLLYPVYALVMGFQIPLWYEFVARAIPNSDRSRFFGQRAVYTGICCLIGTGVLAWLLANLPGARGFQVAFFLAAVLCFISYLGLMQTRFDFDAAAPEAGPRLNLVSSLGHLARHANFRGYLLSRLVLSCSTVASTYYVLYGRDTFHLSTAQSSALAAAFVYLPGLAGGIAGRAADRWGNKFPQIGAALLAGLANVVLLANPSMPTFVIALFCIGFANTVMQMLDPTWLLEFDTRRRALFVSTFNLALIPATSLMPLIGGMIAQSWSYAPVFQIAALGWLGGALLLGILVEKKSQTAAGTSSAMRA